MTPWDDQVSDWLSGVLDASAFAALAGQLDALKQHPRPIVTLFGSYDTGKSAILRRILADEGQQVPEWLTISGRHETFEANEVDVLGCTVRDTPGLVVGGSGDRAQAHNCASSEASALTDAMVVVLTPQLATAELPAVQAMLDRGWADEAVAFAINRFDEAGVSPMDDPDGYADLARRKIRELLEAIPASTAHDIIVVASDPFGLQGPAREVDPDEWDPFRGWDGMGALLDWLGSRSEHAAQLRQGAATRFWREALTATLADLVAAESNLEAALRESAAAGKRMALFEDRLTALDRAARQDLQGELQTIVLGADRRASVSEEWLSSQMDGAISRWFEASLGRVRDLNGELVTEFGLQSARPVVRQLRLLPLPNDSARTLIPARATVERLGNSGLQAWNTFESAQESATARTKRPKRLPAEAANPSAARAASPRPETPTPTSAQAGKPTSPSGSLQAATALAPLVYELFGLLNDWEKDRQQAESAKRRRADLRAQVERILNEVAADNEKEWERVVASQRESALQAWGPLIDQTANTEKQLIRVRDQLQRGRRLASAQVEHGTASPVPGLALPRHLHR